MSGALRYRVDIEAPVINQDEFAGWESDAPPRLVCRVRADILPITSGGYEAFQYGGVISRSDTLILIRDRDDISSDFRVLHGNDEYNIDETIRPRPGTSALMEIHATRRRRGKR